MQMPLETAKFNIGKNLDVLYFDPTPSACDVTEV